MKKIFFITPPDAEYGFSLAGVLQYAAAEEDVEHLLRTAVGDPDTGLVVIDERLMNDTIEKQLQEIEKRWNGITLVLPAPERPGIPVEDYAEKLIRRAIGYHVRLRV